MRTTRTAGRRGSPGSTSSRSGSRCAASLGARERIALVAGRLEESKGVLPLLEAWRALPEDARASWTLLFVGDGPLAGAVDDARRACGAWSDRADARAAPDALAAAYARATCSCSRASAIRGGLVVNEGDGVRPARLCSRLAGCADDLIVPGETGWSCDPTDPAQLRSALATALADPARDRIAGCARATPAKRFGPATLAGGLRRAILRAAARR
jgi:glycosyltransferase involved in cell wall biosynthesis